MMYSRSLNLFLMFVTMLLACAAHADATIQFKPMHERCNDLKRELTGKHLYIKYSDRRQSVSKIHRKKYWNLYWQDTLVPVPIADYETLLIVNYNKAVSGLASKPGFLLIAKDGTAVVFLHYFRTIRYVHTNGMEFAQTLPAQVKHRGLQQDLKLPEASVFLQRKIFKYSPSDIRCRGMGKSKLSYILSLLMVKDSYSAGSLLSAYRNVGRYTGWVALEKIHDSKQHHQLYVWKAFYKRFLTPKIVTNVRIYSPRPNRYGLLIGSKARFMMPVKKRPKWLYDLEQYGRKRSLYRWNRLRRSAQKTGMRFIDRKAR
jgi:hypothetical protein